MSSAHTSPMSLYIIYAFWYTLLPTFKRENQISIIFNFSIPLNIENISSPHSTDKAKTKDTEIKTTVS